MRAVPLNWFGYFLAGFIWSLSVACVDQNEPGTPTKPAAAKSAQQKVQTPGHTTEKKPAKPGTTHDPGQSRGTAKPGSSKTIPRGSGTNLMGGLEKQMWALINRDRADRMNFAETGGHAQPLRWNERLAAVARAHSENMIKKGFVGHVDLKGRTPSERITAAGIPWQATAENIAINPTVQGAQAAFMAEARFQQNHRSNILNQIFTDVGIGIAKGPDGSYYITQDFAAIPVSSRQSGSTFNVANGNR